VPQSRVSRQPVQVQADLLERAVEAALPFAMVTGGIGAQEFRDALRALGGDYERYADEVEADLRAFVRFPPTERNARPKREPVPATLRRAVYERDAYRCVDCGSWENLSIDHVIPWSKGGATTMDNLVTRCMPCNNSKGTR
jgi:hypothetical protein